MSRFCSFAFSMLVTVVLATQCACTSRTRHNNQGNNAMPDQFANIEPNSFKSYPCTPQPAVGDFSFRGILLAGPKKVEFRPDGQSRDLLSDAFGDMIVCGSATFDYNFMELRCHFLFQITFVAVERSTHRSFSGTIAQPGMVTPPVQRDVSKEEGARRVVTKYFNPNLVSMLGLPPQAGIYDVYAHLGEYRSNVVTIELIEAGR